MHGIIHSHAVFYGVAYTPVYAFVEDADGDPQRSLGPLGVVMSKDERGLTSPRQFNVTDRQHGVVARSVARVLHARGGRLIQFCRLQSS